MLKCIFRSRALRIFVGAVGGLVAFAMTFSAQANMSPAFLNDTYSARFIWQEQNANLTNKAFSCPDLIEPKLIFESVSIYKDTPCRCEVDPIKKAAYDAEKAHVKSYMSMLVKLSDLYVATPVEKDEIATCLMQHIESWTHSGAMLGQHVHNVGYHKTAEVLGIVSNSYLKIRHNRAIETVTPLSETGLWMQNAAQHVLTFYDTMAGNSTKNNNHRYWDAYQLGQAAVILNDSVLFQWAIDGLKIGLDQVTEDGILPLELARGSKAYAYHLYAITPLIALAELAVNNPQNMNDAFYPYTYADGALMRLTRMIVAEDSGDTNGMFTDSRVMRCHESAWLEAYAHRVVGEENTEVSILVDERRESCNGKLFNTIAGGNFSLMFGYPS